MKKSLCLEQFSFFIISRATEINSLACIHCWNLENGSFGKLHAMEAWEAKESPTPTQEQNKANCSSKSVMQHPEGRTGGGLQFTE